VLAIDYRTLDPRLYGLGMHRGALFNILFDAVRAERIEIVPATAITGSAVASGGRYLEAASGRRLGPFDLVVDASGAGSPLRRLARGKVASRPFRFGAVWAPVALPADWPTPDRLVQRYHGARIMIGVLPIGSLRVDGPRLAALFWSLPADEHAAWRARGLDRWRAEVKGLWPAVAPLVDQLGSVDDLAFARYSDLVTETPYAERLAIIGDAAHSTSPQLGQGANLALLDAEALARCVAEHGFDIATALARYGALRRDHVRFYQRASRWLTPFFQSESRAAGALRDALLGPAGRIGYLQRQMVATLTGFKTGILAMPDLPRDLGLPAPP
jgi:2-polyprenyl-6-methoxyphenol hydroxylase-like FAD-dependent oxidoreductase